MSANFWVKTIAAGTVAASALMAKGSSQGYQQAMQKNNSAYNADTFYRTMMSEKNLYTGTGWVDESVKGVRRIPIWWNNTVGRAFQQAGIFFNEMIVQNAVPIAMGTIAAFAGFHEELAQGWRGFTWGVKKMIPRGLVSSSALKDAALFVGKGLGKLAALPFQVLHRAGLPGGLALTGLALWGGWQVYRGVNGEKQMDYFRRDRNRYPYI